MTTAEWILAVYLGLAHTMTGPLSVVQPAVATDIALASVNFRGKSLALPLYYGSRLSYFPRPDSWIGIEAEFIHLKVYAETDGITHAGGTYRSEPIDRLISVREVVERFSISHGLNLILVNAAARRTLRRDRKGEMRLIGRVGVGPTLPHAESTIAGVASEGYELGAPAVHAGVGMEIGIRGHLAALAEYKWTRTRQTVAIDQGEAGSLFTSHHGIFGVAWRFR